MAIISDSVITRFEAQIAGYTADVRRAADAFERGQQKQARASNDATRAILADQARVADGIKGVAAGLAAAFTGRELVGALDSYTRLQNTLKVAGLEGDALVAVQDRLLAAAQRTGAGLNNLATLYGSLTTLQKDLNISSDDTLRLTDAVANSIRIGGVSSEQARGGILGLSQALAQGRVQADEYNQILDGLRPLLQAAVNSSDKYKGSLNALRRDIIDTGVSGAQLYEIIAAGAATLASQANKANLTFAQGVNALKDSFAVFFSEQGGGIEVSRALGAALKGIADNLGILAPAIAIVAVAIGSRYVAASLAASASTGALSTALFAVQARAVGAATSMEALAFAGRAAGASILSAFGGPVGLAITAITVAIGFLIFRTDDLTAANQRARDAELASSQARNQAIDLHQRAAKAIGAEKAALEGLIAAKVQETRVNAIRAASDAKAAKARFDASKREFDAVRGANDSQSRGVRADAFNRAKAAFSDLESASGTARAAQEAIAILKNGPAASTRTVAGVASDGKGKKAPKGTSTETLAKRAEASRVKEVRDDFAFQRDLNAARTDDLRAQQDLVTSIETRAELEQMLIDIAQQQVNAELTRDGPGGTKRYTAAEVERLKILNDQTALNRRNLVVLQTEEALREQARDIAAGDIRNKTDLANLEAQLAETSGERLAIELRLVDLQFEEEKARLEAVTASKLATDAEKQIATARLALLPQLKAGAVAAAQQDNEGPLARFRRESRITKDDLESIEVDGIRDISEGLADAALKANSLSGAFKGIGKTFKDVANSIIRDLIRISIQQAIVGAIGGGSDSGGGTLSSIGGLLSGRREFGGPVSAGKAYLVGEREPEIFVPDRSGTIVPSISQFQNPQLAGRGSATGGGTSTIRLILSGDIKAEMLDVAAGVSFQVVEQSKPAIMAGAAQATINALNRPRQNR